MKMTDPCEKYIAIEKILISTAENLFVQNDISPPIAKMIAGNVYREFLERCVEGILINRIENKPLDKVSQVTDTIRGFYKQQQGNAEKEG